jgi:hypothetical protein
MSQQWIDDLNLFIRFAEKANDRIESGEADRVEILMCLNALMGILAQSANNWINWFKNPAVLATVDLEELRRLWRKLYPHVIGILHEDIRHTQEIEREIEKNRNRSPFLALLYQHQQVSISSQYV